MGNHKDRLVTKGYSLCAKPGTPSNTERYGSRRNGSGTYPRNDCTGTEWKGRLEHANSGKESQRNMSPAVAGAYLSVENMDSFINKRNL